MLSSSDAKDFYACAASIRFLQATRLSLLNGVPVRGAGTDIVSTPVWSIRGRICSTGRLKPELQCGKTALRLKNF
jgi:hypothetical protein